MKLSDLNKYKFKRRSLPNDKTFRRYLDAYAIYFLVFGIFNFIYVCLISKDLTPVMPFPFVVAFPMVFIHVYRTLEEEYIFVSKDTFREVVVHIRLKQYHSLKEKIADHPELLTANYNNKSLLYYARHYKNLQANSIILEQLKKPR